MAAGANSTPWPEPESCEITAEVELPYVGYCAAAELDEPLSWCVCVPREELIVSDGC